MTLLTHGVSANEAKSYSQNRLKESVSKESNNKIKEPLFELKNDNKEISFNGNLPIETKDENKKSLWKNIAIGASALVTAGIIGFLAFKGIKMSKELTKTKDLLAQTTAELSTTKNALAQTTAKLENAKKILKSDIQKAVQEKISSSTSVKDGFMSLLQDLTDSLRSINQLGSECNNFCNTAKNIKNAVH